MKPKFSHKLFGMTFFVASLTTLIMLPFFDNSSSTVENVQTNSTTQSYNNPTQDAYVNGYVKGINVTRVSYGSLDISIEFTDKFSQASVPDVVFEYIGLRASSDNLSWGPTTYYYVNTPSDSLSNAISPTMTVNFDPEQKSSQLEKDINVEIVYKIQGELTGVDKFLFYGSYGGVPSDSIPVLVNYSATSLQSSFIYHGPEFTMSDQAPADYQGETLLPVYTRLINETTGSILPPITLLAGPGEVIDIEGEAIQYEYVNLTPGTRYHAEFAIYDNEGPQKTAFENAVLTSSVYLNSLYDPIIVGVQNITPNEVNIYYSFDGSGSSEIYWRVTERLTGIEVIEDSASHNELNGTINLEGLTAQTEYEIEVWVGENRPTSTSFVTDFALNDTPTLKSVTQTSATFTFNWEDELNAGNVYWGVQKYVPLNDGSGQGEWVLQEDPNFRGQFVLDSSNEVWTSPDILDFNTNYRFIFTSDVGGTLGDGSEDEKYVTLTTDGGFGSLEATNITATGANIVYTFNGNNQTDVWLEISKYDEGDPTLDSSWEQLQTLKAVAEPGTNNWLIPEGSLSAGTSYKVEIFFEPNKITQSQEIQFSTLSPLNTAPEVTYLAPNKVEMNYTWNSPIEGEIYWTTYMMDEQDPTQLPEDAEQVQGSNFNGMFKAIESNGTFKTKDVLEDGSTYYFVFSAVSDDFAPTFGDNFTSATDKVYVEVNTPTGISFFNVVPTYTGAKNVHINGSSYDYFVYYELYATNNTETTSDDSFVEADDALITASMGSFDIPDGTLEYNTQYRIDIFENSLKKEVQHSFTFKTKSTVMGQVNVEETTSTSITFSYYWYQEENDPNNPKKPIYSIDGGAIWHEITSEMTGDNPTSTGKHTFTIYGLEPNEHYSLQMKFSEDSKAKVYTVATATTEKAVENANISVNNTTMNLEFYWQPGYSKDTKLWLWIGDTSTNPYASDALTTESFNSWIELTGANQKNLSVDAYEVNNISIDWLEANSQYTVILSTNRTSKADEIDITSPDLVGNDIYTTYGAISNNSTKTIIIVTTIVLISILILVIWRAYWVKTRAAHNMRNDGHKIGKWNSRWG